MSRRRRHADPHTLSDLGEDWLTYRIPMLHRDGSPFESEARARRAWEIHGDDLMQEWKHAGTRPAGWWDFEAEEDRPEPWSGEEVRRLGQLGALTEDEIHQINHKWPGVLDASEPEPWRAE